MRRLVAGILLMLSVLSVNAQVRLVDCTPYHDMPLPSPMSNLSLLDGKVSLYVSGIWMSAQVVDGRIVFVEPDSLVHVCAPDADYVVQHPVSRSLFYTEKNGEGLMELRRKRNKLEGVAVPFEAEGSLQMCHPVFSTDGMFLVYSTDKRIGKGGYDLWYYQWKRNRWDGPYNMGGRVNTPGNEINPTIVGDYLVFASDGRSGRVDYDFYATRLVALYNSDDTVGMVPIGRAAVQPLPDFVNDNGNQLFFVNDTVQHVCYWMNLTRDSVEQLVMFENDMKGVLLRGMVSSAVGGHPVPETVVKVLDKDSRRVVDSMVTDRTGVYSFYLPVAETFRLAFNAPDYFNDTITVFTRRDNEEKLIADQVHDVRLSRLELNSVLYFSDVFVDGVGFELHPRVDNSMRQLVTFLNDNPHIEAYITITSDVTSDKDFNIMLTNKRLKQLVRYLSEKVSDNFVSLKNGDSDPMIFANGSGYTVVSVRLLKD